MRANRARNRCDAWLDSPISTKTISIIPPIKPSPISRRCNVGGATARVAAIGDGVAAINSLSTVAATGTVATGRVAITTATMVDTGVGRGINAVGALVANGGRSNTAVTTGRVTATLADRLSLTITTGSRVGSTVATGTTVATTGT